MGKKRPGIFDEGEAAVFCCSGPAGSLRSGGNRGWPWPGLAVRGCMGLTQRVFLCTPGPWGYLGNAMAGRGVSSCPLPCLSGCLQKGGGGFLSHLPLEPGWDRAAGGRVACPKAVGGERPDLPLLPGRGQGTEMPPLLGCTTSMLGQRGLDTCIAKC